MRQLSVVMNILFTSLEINYRLLSENTTGRVIDCARRIGTGTAYCDFVWGSDGTPTDVPQFAR